MLVLDTNTVIYYFKGMGKVAENLLATPPREIAIPAVVVYELEVGAVKSGSPHRRRRQLEELLTWVTLLPFGAGEARTSALVRAELERQGRPVGPIDTLIAGTALHHGATLVTRNLKELEPIRHLRTVSWYDEIVS